MSATYKEPNKRDVVEAILDGIRRAQGEHFHGTGHVFATWGPEYLFTTTIAQELWKREFLVYLEENLARAKMDAGAKRKSAKEKKQGASANSVRPNARCDITVYNADFWPLCCIEVKRYHDNIGGDINRMASTLSSCSAPGGSLQFTACAFYAGMNDGADNATGEKRLMKALEAIREKAGKIASLHGVFMELHHRGAIPETWEDLWDNERYSGAWTPACLVFTRNRE